MLLVVLSFLQAPAFFVVCEKRRYVDTLMLPSDTSQGPRVEGLTPLPDGRRIAVSTLWLKPCFSELKSLEVNPARGEAANREGDECNTVSVQEIYSASS
jgi:hypothetical protein